MGLMTTDYKVKELGITLPTAYTIINRLEEQDGTVIAEFYVQTTREAALLKKPIQRVILKCPIGRDENPKTAIYTFAKSYRTENEIDAKSGETIEKQIANSIFSGWEDDLKTTEERKAEKQAELDAAAEAAKVAEQTEEETTTVTTE